MILAATCGMFSTSVWLEGRGNIGPTGYLGVLQLGWTAWEGGQTGTGRKASGEQDFNLRVVMYSSRG